MMTFAAVGLAALMALAPAPHDAPRPCHDRTVATLREAGWKGSPLRVAYAVSWRESNHNPDAVGAGSYGLFQLQESAWAGSRFWPADPLDAVSNAKAARRIWRAFSWRPWGLNAAGDGVDRRDYTGWSEDQIISWVWQPYTVGLAKFDRLPAGCKS